MSDLATPGANAFIDGTALGATLYVQLHTGNPGTNGTANVASENVRSSFTRTAASAGVSTNVGAVQWTNVVADETITHITIWSLSSGGICWFINDCPDTSIFLGDTVTIIAGALSITVPVWT